MDSDSEQSQDEHVREQEKVQESQLKMERRIMNVIRRIIKDRNRAGYQNIQTFFNRMRTANGNGSPERIYPRYARRRNNNK